MKDPRGAATGVLIFPDESRLVRVGSNPWCEAWGKAEKRRGSFYRITIFPTMPSFS